MRVRYHLPLDEQVSPSPQDDAVNSLRLFGLLYGLPSAILAVCINPWLLNHLSSDGLSPETITRIYDFQVRWGIFGALCLGLAWLLGRRPRDVAGPRDTRRVNIGLSVSMVTYVLLVTESVLAFKFVPSYALTDDFDSTRIPFMLPDAYLGHVLNPLTPPPYHINSQGYRGAMPLPKDNPEDIHLITAGDSNTFGWGVNDESATYPAKLQALLNERKGGHRHTVLNAGIPSYSSLQILRLIRTRLATLKPDVLVVCAGWNDLAFSYLPNWTPDLSQHSAPAEPYRVYRPFSPAILMAVRAIQPMVMDWLHRLAMTPRTPDPRAVDAFRSNLQEIAVVARQHKIPLVFVQMPTILSRDAMTVDEVNKVSQTVLPNRVSWDGLTPPERTMLAQEITNVWRFQSVVSEVSRSEGVPLVDQPAELFDLDASGKGRYFADLCHPNEDGATLLAQAVFEHLISTILAEESSFDPRPR